LGIKLEIIVVQARDNEELRKINPLKKIPALVLDDGSVIFDSPVICEYLNYTGGGKFFPGTGVFSHHTQHWKALTLQALADGLMDAAVALRYESTDETKRNADHMARYRATIDAGLDALERVKFVDPPTIGEIATACALGYLDFRYADIPWRDTHPKLAEWFAKFSEYPSMKATVPAA
ncbi:MAG: glutathione S-transferase family protein, partial [Alphaproteobacteria bacterium]|nr:glutathione S-transferase family protein [Alphaproteobacteria bacterium]